ncbi:MAG: ArsR/SmtB family transcription factor [Ktedonobacterales bacterium]
MPARLPHTASDFSYTYCIAGFVRVSSKYGCRANPTHDGRTELDAAPNPVTVAALIGEPARATILLALFGGEARPATDLAYRCRLTPQTVSAHLAKLVEGGLLAVERSGRHKYYRLASPEVGHALEALNVLAPRRPVRSLGQSEETKALCFARTCYDHLAGAVGVDMADALVSHGYAELSDGHFHVTPAGTIWLMRIGIDTANLAYGRRAFAPQCLDWSERRHHMAGALGAALTARLFDLGWITRLPTSRAVRLTRSGQAGLLVELDLRLPIE